MDIREIITIRDRLKNDLAVVEKFLAIAQRHGLASNENHEAVQAKQATLKPILGESLADYGSIGKAIVEAIKLSPTEFTIVDVDSVLRDHFRYTLDRTQIATVLARLTRQNKVQVVKPKHGRRGAVYKHL